MSISFDDLFALRISLQDNFQDESAIIREIKYELCMSGMPNTEINKYVVDFYKNFGIDISLDIVSQIPTPQPPPIQNIPNLSHILNNPQQFLQIMMPNINYPNNQANNNSDSDSSENDTDSLPSLDDNHPVEDQQNVNPPANSQQNVNSNYNLSLITNTGHTLNLSANNIPNTPNANTFYNIFSQLINAQPPNMEDVLVTLDDDDLSKMETLIVKEDSDSKCGVCMSKYKKDEKLYLLPCKHKFHKECIEPWLKQYNYKCPICRKECGKSKIHN